MSAAKRIAPATCAALLLITLSACSGGVEKAEQKPVGKVNGTVITKAQLDRTVKELVAQNSGTQALPPEKMQKVADLALEQLTSAELLYQEAAKLEIKDLDKLVAEKFAQNKAGFPTEAEFQKSLKEFKMTEEDVREAMRKGIVVNHFITKEFIPKATVSEEEARKFYDRNLEKLFKKKERVRASHILVSVYPTAPAAERKQAKQKAEALLKRVQGGEDFAAVAKKDSNCPSSARGGELGEFPRGEMAAPVEKAAFSLKPGELSGVVESEFGYHVIKLTEKLPAYTAGYEEVKKNILAHLMKEHVKQAIVDYVAGLRGKAKIEKS